MTNLPFNGKFKCTKAYRVAGNYKAKFHTGIDLVGLDNTSIYSVCNGKVIFAGNNGAYGKCIKIKDNETGKVFLFAHLSVIYVKVGQVVSRLTKLGLMGSTGNSTGSHLHIEMRTSNDKYGEVENIADYMKIPNKVGDYNSADYSLGKNIYYEAHIQDIGWQEQKKNGEIAGTVGEAKRIEAIKIFADIPLKYRVHLENKGWTDYVSNGEIAGTVGESRRLEAIEIVSKSNKLIKAQAHIQNIDWQQELVGQNIIIGTEGQGLRLEALKLELV